MLVAGRQTSLHHPVHTVAVDPFPFHWHQVPVVAGSVVFALPPNITLHDIVSFFCAVRALMSHNTRRRWSPFAC